MELVSRQEAREYRIELALQEIEQAAMVARFRPEVADRNLAEIGHRVKQLRADLVNQGALHHTVDGLYARSMERLGDLHALRGGVEPC